MSCNATILTRISEWFSPSPHHTRIEEKSMNVRNGAIAVFLMTLIPLSGMAQLQRDVAPLRPWPAPLLWQPTPAESQPFAAADQVNATSPANSLVFVGMT